MRFAHVPDGTLVLASTNADTVPELAILLDDQVNLTVNDFFL